MPPMGMMGGMASTVPPPPAPAPPPAPVAAAPAAEVDEPPLPDKDPRDLRLQYKNYLATCVRQEREPEDGITKLITRLARERPPGPNEDEEMKEIRLFERYLGIAIHVDPSEPPPTTEELEAIGVTVISKAPKEVAEGLDGYHEAIGDRAARIKEAIQNKEVPLLLQSRLHQLLRQLR